MKNRGIILFSLLSILVLWISSLTAQPPSGYYNTATGTGATLKTQLYDIIKNHTVRGYDQLWIDFQTTDDKPNGKVWDIYSDIPGGTPAYEYSFLSDKCGTYNSEGDCYNREHSVPSSWFNDASPMYSDLFHVYPTDGFVNNKRSNYPYGQVGTATWTSTNGSKLGISNFPGYSGVVFEPRADFKGDLARTYFYMATRYENVINGWNSPMLNKTVYPAFSSWAISLLLQWHTADPVSQKEIDRNNTIYALQGNRNPYIDNPNFALLIWGSGASLADEPAAYPTHFSGSTITLQWSESTGTYLPEGYLIRMSSTGFEAIAAPTDGIPVANDANNKNIPYGLGQAVFGGLTPGQTYYFKIYPYAGNGNQIDYKTDGAVRQVSIVAQ